MVGRTCKTLLVLAVAFLLALVAANNVLDPASNFHFVEHVLSMDTVSPDTPLRARAIENATVHWLFYYSIIAWESLAAALCAVGGVRMLLSVRADAASFHRAVGLAELGLIASLLLWLVAFLTVGGEWFVMWQSSSWNGQNAAGRMFVVTGIVLLYLKQPEGACLPSATENAR